MELDALREKWAEQDRRLEASVRLNQKLLREVKMSRVRSPLRRFAWMVGGGAALELVGIALTGAFLVAHWDEPRFLVPALLLDGWLIAMLVSAVRQLVLWRGIDYEQPIGRIQRQLEELRVLRVRTVKWGLLTGQLVWWVPWVVVAMKGFLGVDAYEMFGYGFVLVNLAFGWAMIPLAVWVARRYGEEMGGWPVMRGLARDLSGREVEGAIAFLGTLEDFEEERIEGC